MQRFRYNVVRGQTHPMLCGIVTGTGNRYEFFVPCIDSTHVYSEIT